MNWLEGEEFLLTAGYAFHEDEVQKENMLKIAHEKNVSAIAIKENRYFGKIEEKLIDEANYFGIPLIKLPYEVIYSSTVSAFYNKLFFKSNEYILDLNNVYEKLLDLSFENKEVDGIVQSIANITNSNVYLFDEQFNLFTKSIINEQTHEDIINAKPFSTHSTEFLSYRKINSPINNIYMSVYRILKNFKNLYLFIVKNIKLDELSINAIEYGVSIISSKLERDRISRFSQLRFSKTVVNMILKNRDLPMEFYKNLEAELNWEFQGNIIGVCINISDYDIEYVDDYKNDIFNTINFVFNGANYLSTDRPDEIFIFFKSSPEVNQIQLIEDLYNNLNYFDEKFQASIGVSNQYTQIKELDSMYEESLLAALFAGNNIINFGKLDIINLLYPLRNDKQINEYYNKTIGKLEEYDKLIMQIYSKH